MIIAKFRVDLINILKLQSVEPRCPIIGLPDI